MPTPTFNKYDLLVHDGADIGLPESLKALFFLTTISLIAYKLSPTFQSITIGIMTGIMVSVINYFDNDLRARPNPPGNKGDIPPSH